MNRRRSRRTVLDLVRLVLVSTLLAAAALFVPATSAHALDGIYHHPTGIDELYSVESTERSPRDPMAGDNVLINATTWPVEPGQSVWVTWTKNGVDQTPVGASWEYNSGNNSYWQVDLGSFARGDDITYTVHADVNGSGQKSTGPFSFTVTSWSTVTDVIGYTDNGTSVDVHAGDSAGDFTPAIRFAFPSDDDVRTQISPTGNGLNISGQSGYTVADSANELRISTSELVLSIQKSPYRLSVYDGDGTTLITRQYDPATFRNIGWASDGSTTITKIEDHYLTPAGERFEGFGERYDRLDQRGHDVHTYVYNQYQDQGSTGRTYLSVPFFTNSAGYGVYLPSTRYSVFNLGTHLSDMAGFTLDTGGALDSTLEYYMFTGSPDEIVDDYTSVSGRPELPPKWAFGLWMSANEWNTQAEVEAELDNVDIHDIPHTAMVLEQWSDEATFYVWHGATYTPTSGAGSLSYSDLTFPPGTAWSDPAAMVDDAHAQGIKVLLWQIPVLKENFDTNPSSPPQQHLNDKSHAQSQGYVVEDGDGGDYRVPSGQWFGDSLVPDFTDSTATDWWMSKRDYLLDDVGIDGFKTDGGELIFGRDVAFADGRDGAEMHNAYPNSYTGAYDDYVETKTGGDGTIFSRAGTAGAQSNSIFWAGDQSSTFTSFREAVRAGISAGQSGVPFWAWDMAGFTGGFPSAELYLRSAAQATFSPIMQYHSEKASPSPSEARTPWNVQARTGDNSVVPTFRKFANVRMNLLPYVYTEAVDSADTGVAMMRAMSHEFPDDPDAAGLDEQYMFGEQLLVAPIMEQGATSTDVYIPDGEWYDFFNGGRFVGGGTKTYGAGLDSIPVYARPGAIVPLNLNADYELGGSIGNDVDAHTNLVFRVYPDGASSYDYYDDATDTHRTVSASEDWADHEVSVEVPALGETSTLQVASTEPSSVTVGGSPLTGYADLAGLKAATQGWYWDPVQHLTYVKLPSAAGARAVLLSGVDKAGYEAEFGQHTNVSTNTDHAGYTGTGFVDQFASSGDAVEFGVGAGSSGTHELRFRYANATGSTATRTVYVDGSPVGTVSMPSRSGWDDWGEASISVGLSGGAHTVRIAYDGSDTGAVNLDRLVVARP
ncbi:TIM-barrel domain-containing protein [Phytoactinopolyspora halotolerans]|uniref:Carbohydrate-binding protein n=1 Tax=Phytoactinopolyspora halotolerans TaxID=1981512 RepID=A0A6L9SBT7_9ACTN|nr:TIM-barrel domain-containing protein [Phytoactinopolyspora halotolerans]NEE02489.1 carbohydrate-binding protein [Phytoactinopolyspora halotolerans]